MMEPMKPPTVVLGAALLAVGLLLSGAAPLSAAFPGVNGAIAFASSRDGNYEIYTMNPDATAQTRLTQDPASDVDPAWSPDGRRIAFTSNRDGNDEIFVMNADGSGETRLTSSPGDDVNPSWSPGGRNIVFASTRDGNGEIYVMNDDGTGQTRLTSNPAADAVPAWSPDGKKIAFTSGRDGSNDIYVMNVDGTGQTRLTTDPRSDVSPAWSPDGTKIAFASDRDGNYEIYVMNADGSGQTRLTRNVFIDLDPAWSPDGKSITFTSNRDGNYQIYSMAADGSGQTRLTTNSANDTTADWQPVIVPTAVKGAVFRGSWRESVYRGGLEVTGHVDGQARLQLSLVQGTQTWLSRTLDLPAGDFGQTLPLPAGLLPGTYKLEVRTDGSPTQLSSQDIPVPLAPPPEGVVARALVSTAPGGLPVRRFPRTTLIVWVTFRFAPGALPRAGLPLAVSWYRPPGGVLVGHRVPVRRRSVVTSHVNSRSNTVPIPRGAWLSDLRAGTVVVKRVSFRVG
jgi:Tol biopolymer transport system component